MREKKFGKRCLTWVLIMMMTLSLLPVSAMAADGEARFYRKNVTSTYARDTGLTAEQSDKNDQGNDEAGEVPEEERMKRCERRLRQQMKLILSYWRKI